MGPSAVHVLLALAIQAVVGVAYGLAGAGPLTPWIGATAATVFYVSREIAQSFRYSDPGRLALRGWATIRQAGWPAFATHAAALVLTIAAG